jgi:hypothetical protein
MNVIFMQFFIAQLHNRARLYRESILTFFNVYNVRRRVLLASTRLFNVFIIFYLFILFSPY